MVNIIEEQNLDQGLSSEDQGLLNIPPRATSHEEDSAKRLLLIEEKRKQYEGDALAQEEIDIYDPNSQYSLKTNQLVIALKNRDYQKRR